MQAWLAVGLVVAAVGCKDREVPRPAEVPLAQPRVTDDLVLTARGSAFEVADHEGKIHVTLPDKPTLSGEMTSQSGVEVYNAQAVMPGGAVDVQFGVASVMDGELPPGMLAALDGIPAQLAASTGGKLAKNETGTLAGRPARIFELTTPDARRLFGWYIGAGARMVQINCVGPDGPEARAACGAVAQSLTIQ